MLAQVFPVASLAAFAIAGPLHTRSRLHTRIPEQCANGIVQCCDQIPQSQQFSSAGDYDNFIGGQVVAEALASANCSPIGILEIGTQCTAQIACCTTTKFNGVANFGCSAISA